MVDETALPKVVDDVRAVESTREAATRALAALADIIRENAPHPGAVLHLADQVDTYKHALAAAIVETHVSTETAEPPAA